MIRLREDKGKQVKTYERGFPVGFKDDSGKVYINNHLHFTILYHRDDITDLARIVGFEVEPYSVAHVYDGKWDDAKPPKLKFKLAKQREERPEERSVKLTHPRLAHCSHG